MSACWWFIPGMKLYHFMLRSIWHLVPTWQPWLRVLQQWPGLAMHPTSARAGLKIPRYRAGRNPRAFFELSWVDLHGIYSTFMFFHMHFGLCELTVFSMKEAFVWSFIWATILLWGTFLCKPCPNGREVTTPGPCHGCGARTRPALRHPTPEPTYSYGGGWWKSQLNGNS